MKIGLAMTEDHASTRRVVDQAFRPEDVVSFLDALRADGCILDEWVAEDESGLLGHIVFSRVWVEQGNGARLPAAMLTPLAVRPDRQRSGIGTDLMNHAIQELEARGETLFLVLGHPDYYPRAGFSAEKAAKVESPWTGNPAFMARASSAPEGKLILPQPIIDAA
ncbi:MAG: N-acetyltransferase [Alphaproteobacteria bacterium]|nr:N-acetyltransferase [Alphaproteobacteria bacterium]